MFAAFWVMALRAAHSLSRSPLLPYRAFGNALIVILVMNILGMFVNNELFDLQRMVVTSILLGLALAALRSRPILPPPLDRSSHDPRVVGERIATKS